jgi:hypothetical protein
MQSFAQWSNLSPKHSVAPKQTSKLKRCVLCVLWKHGKKIAHICTGPTIDMSSSWSPMGFRWWCLGSRGTETKGNSTGNKKHHKLSIQVCLWVQFKTLWAATSRVVGNSHHHYSQAMASWQGPLLFRNWVLFPLPQIRMMTTLKSMEVSQKCKQAPVKDIVALVLRQTP